jgi:hypothetical protein
MPWTIIAAIIPAGSARRNARPASNKSSEVAERWPTPGNPDGTVAEALRMLESRYSTARKRTME